MDNCAVAASILLHDRADRTHRHAHLHQRWLTQLRERSTHPGSGLLIQSIHPVTGEAMMLALLTAQPLDTAGNGGAR